ncbi:MAG TPA: PDZ domain-containing protein [Candidatus Acidoferrum sp.]|nr:PDZ domain-containing protein [Candidatus Acidoferrum sp.]
MVNGLWRFSLLPVVVLFLQISNAGATEPLLYELGFEAPNTHLMDVTIRATGLDNSTTDFAMPDWAPGSYYIQNYAANVQRFRATGENGKELSWRKTDSQTWRVELSGAKTATIQYQVFGDTLRNNQAQYDERHAFIGGPSVWMYLVDGKERPIELSVAVPSGWKVATGMEHMSDHTFRAKNYDWFADAPLEISDFAEKDFQVLGTTYHVIVHNIESREDFSEFTTDVQKLVETIVPIFSSVAGDSKQAAPFKDYYFLFHIWPGTGGGLEHLNSTQINFSRDWDDKSPAEGYGTQYDEKLFVASHEFFHAWNVKRLRPHPLGPFDYSGMVHTPSLWISEGLTSYYGALALVRAGLITPQHYLDGIGKLMTKFESQPGRSERSIEDTSWDTWFPIGGVVQQKNNLANTWYSYYDGGQLMGHILDFAIREKTNNRKSLDDWMRLIYSRYALPNPGFEPDDAIRSASEIAGADLSDIFQRYISGRQPIPYEKYFAYAGISVTAKVDSTRPWLGVETVAGANGRLTIKNVIPGSPAEKSGLDRDDVILAVDEHALGSGGLAEPIKERKPGDVIQVMVSRLGEIKVIPVTIGSNPHPTYTLKPMEHLTNEQEAIYKTWMGLK